ncbi:hypothetical protein EGW08_007032 [Elysia chlorotica]|uniref:RNA ligase domain-containing protein n=1 Tax=Elysia chlorotica TaxID=188477 RepID=A0A433TUG3_ELYCH|nr:hypothetical protein EGW08_007032 [Elysia chlorotica]
MGDKNKISFCAMTSIMKTASLRENNCHDWVATEKVHGASFQFYTSDGDTIHLGSRTRSLDGNVSFLKCNLAEFKERHSEYVKDLYNQVKTVKRWRHYVEFLEEFTYDSDDDEDYEAVSETKDECVEDIEGEESTIENVRVTEESRDNNVEVRIYGELYGGGGVNKDVKPAVQKEIIYSDEFRFYVFGITINKKWVSIVEMNDLCKNAGFPYYATPVCEPMDTLEELKNFLISSGFMNSKSRLTDRTDDFKTKIEGVVMSPLTRPDYKRHAIKNILHSALYNKATKQTEKWDEKCNDCLGFRVSSAIPVDCVIIWSHCT